MWPLTPGRPCRPTWRWQGSVRVPVTCCRSLWPSSSSSCSSPSSLVCRLCLPRSGQHLHCRRDITDISSQISWKIITDIWNHLISTKAFPPFSEEIIVNLWKHIDYMPKKYCHKYLWDIQDIKIEVTSSKVSAVFVRYCEISRTYHQKYQITLWKHSIYLVMS